MSTADPGTALVVARHRRHVEIETGGVRLNCIAAGRSLQALCGDQVEWHRRPDGTCVVTQVRERETLLTRIDKRGRPEPVAANLSQLVAVVAAAPAPDWSLLDRYLAAAELLDIGAAIICNKRDLASASGRLDEYARIGYALVETSVVDGTGLSALERLLRGERSALLGQSGVGKSSLLNALVGDSVQAVGELGGKRKRGHGRHTTTTAVLHRLPGGGELVDMPGVRQYAPYIDDSADVARGFREFAPYLGRCRFDDCRHRAEPECAVKAAVEAGAIARARYDNYLELEALARLPGR